MEIVLASASDRRSQLLQQLHIPHRILPVFIDETVLDDEPIDQYVERMARSKAKAAKDTGLGDVFILAADTSIEVDREILGKPANEEHAMAMLRCLSGRAHHVLSGVCIMQGLRTVYSASNTRVQFKELSESDIASYVRTGEPMGKAGSYAIQGLAAMFVENINGSYSGVMGLPLFETVSLLEQTGYHVLSKSTDWNTYE